MMQRINLLFDLKIRFQSHFNILTLTYLEWNHMTTEENCESRPDCRRYNYVMKYPSSSAGFIALPASQTATIWNGTMNMIKASLLRKQPSKMKISISEITRLTTQLTSNIIHERASDEIAWEKWQHYIRSAGYLSMLPYSNINNKLSIPFHSVSWIKETPRCRPRWIPANFRALNLTFSMIWFRLFYCVNFV